MVVPRRRAPAIALVAALLGALVALVGPAPAPIAAAPRPDIVVVMLDDMTIQQMVHLPTLSALARAGTSFTSHVASTSECCPSRATFLTGQYTHNHGVLSGLAPTGGYGKLDHTNALPVWLRDAGYHTIHVGKYMNGVGLSDPRQRPAGWDRYAGLIDPSTYDYWNYKVNHDGVVEAHGTAPEDYQTDVLGQMAVDDILTAPDNRSLFLSFAPLAPHAGTVAGSGPRYPVPPPRHRKTFTGALPVSPATNETDVSDKPAYVRTRPALTATNLTNITSWWRQSIEALRAADEAVARIVEALRESGRLANTVFVLTSDNGFLHGEHRISLGKVWPYEPSIRVPLVLSGAGIPSSATRTTLTVSADVAPTIVALAGAGAQVRRTMDGISLLPMLTDNGYGVGRAQLVELGRLGGRLTYRGIRGTRWKYVEYSSGEKELYDLVTDPHELTNRAGDPALTSLQAALSSRLARLATCQGAACASTS